MADGAIGYRKDRYWKCGWRVSGGFRKFVSLVAAKGFSRLDGLAAELGQPLVFARSVERFKRPALSHRFLRRHGAVRVQRRFAKQPPERYCRISFAYGVLREGQHAAGRGCVSSLSSGRTSDVF